MLYFISTCSWLLYNYFWFIQAKIQKQVSRIAGENNYCHIRQYRDKLLKISVEVPITQFKSRLMENKKNIWEKQSKERSSEGRF